MAGNVTNEMILEDLKALREEVKKARMESHEIRDELRVVKDHLSMLVQNDLDRDSQPGPERTRQVPPFDN